MLQETGVPMSRCTILLTIALLALVISVNGRTLYVPAGASLRDSVTAATYGDTVMVGPGFFYGTITWPATGGIVLISEMGPEATTLDGAEANAVIRISGVTIDTFTVIHGFTITRGSSINGGGGIHLESGASPRISGNIIADNHTTASGGGILALTTCHPTIRDNQILDNSADSSGGGIAVIDRSNARILGNTISGNSSGRFGGGVSFASECSGLLQDNRIVFNSSENGGGIYENFLCSPDIIDNTVVANVTLSGNGGGLLTTEACGGTISGNTFANDTALTNGGGMALWGFQGQAVGNSVVDNVSYQSGGGIDLASSAASLIGNVISRNKTGNFGGGVFCGQSQPVIESNIISDNSATFGGGLYVPINATPVIGNSESTGNDIYHNISGDGANIKNFADIAATVGSTLNFWGRTGDLSSDSTAIAGTISNLGSLDWWPIRLTPLTISRTPRGSTDTMYFNECTIALANITFAGSGDSSISVTAWPDVTPSYGTSGRFPLRKLFDIDAGPGVIGFTADLTLYYSQGEVDTILDIQSEATLQVFQFNDPEWDSCATLGRDTLRNSVTCQISGPARFILVGTDQLPTDVDDEVPGSLPDGFGLSQNYPNPFNPTTEFEYSTPVRSHVVIDIYNILGRKVCTLVDGERSAGTYRVFWDGRDENNQTVSSGVYLYRMTADTVVLTKKMVLVK